MASSVLELERNICRLEHRTPTTKTRILTETSSPWKRFQENPKVLHHEAAAVIEMAFDEGGYVAGGCARWLRNHPVVTALHRGCYVRAGGDIDLFFRDEAGWRRFVERTMRVAERGDLRARLKTSKGNLAVNISIGSGGYAYDSPPNIQAICCATAEPDEMLRGFDFVNAMVAFDRDTSWVAEEWNDHEEAKTLGVAWWGSRAVAARTEKYLSKYAYTSLLDLSDGRMVEQLTAGYDAMSDAKKSISAETWRRIVKRSGLNLTMETKLTILGAATDGLNADDIFEASKETPPGSIGTYEFFILDLIKRQERARAAAKSTQLLPIDRDMWKEAHEASDIDGANFDAEEYCWAV